MRQDDYFLNQLDILGRVLGKALADILRLKKQGQVMDGIEITSQALKAELDLDLSELLAIPNEKFIETLLTNEKNKLEHLEKLAEILYELGNGLHENNNQNRKIYFEKANLLFEYVNKHSTTYSIDRMNKMKVLSLKS